MTPLARKILKLAIKNGDKDTIEELRDIHCFKVTSIEKLAEEMSFSFQNNEVDTDFLFTPFENTWIEWDYYDENTQEDYQFAVLCGTIQSNSYHPNHQEDEDLKQWEHYVTNGYANEDGTWPIDSIWFCHYISHHNGGGYKRTPDITDDCDEFVFIEIPWLVMYSDALVIHPDLRAIGYMLCSFLTLINTPLNIGLKTHAAPKFGLRKELKQIDGKFPLNAWSEITLKCRTKLHEDTQSKEWIDGKAKCLHWVRAFKRWKLGKPELVKAHLRGDPALGFKQSRYKVEKG